MKQLRCPQKPPFIGPQKTGIEREEKQDKQSKRKYHLMKEIQKRVGLKGRKRGMKEIEIVHSLEMELEQM